MRLRSVILALSKLLGFVHISSSANHATAFCTLPVESDARNLRRKSCQPCLLQFLFGIRYDTIEEFNVD